MFEDSPYLYACCDLPSNPLRPDATWQYGEYSHAKIGDNGLITDEMADLISSMGLRLERLLLWTWKKPPSEHDGDFYTIHSDGHVGDPTQRKCSLNWLIEGDSQVDWYSYQDATLRSRPVLHDKRLTLTNWDYGTKPESLATWTGKMPALLNIRQPHNVTVNGNGARRSIAMRFLPNIGMDEFVTRLGNRIRTINREH